MIEHLIAEAHELGWYIYQAHESTDYGWRVYIRHPDCLISYGQGPNLAVALEMALAAIPNALSHALPKISSTIAAPTSLASIVASLRAPTVPMKRRI